MHLNKELDQGTLAWVVTAVKKLQHGRWQQRSQQSGKSWQLSDLPLAGTPIPAPLEQLQQTL